MENRKLTSSDEYLVIGDQANYEISANSKIRSVLFINQSPYTILLNNSVKLPPLKFFSWKADEGRYFEKKFDYKFLVNEGAKTTTVVSTSDQNELQVAICVTYNLE